MKSFLITLSIWLSIGFCSGTWLSYHTREPLKLDDAIYFSLAGPITPIIIISIMIDLEDLSEITIFDFGEE